MTAIFLDYENYYVGMTMHLDPATRDARVVNSNRFAPTIVSSRTIDNYVTGSDAVPAAGAAAIAAFLVLLFHFRDVTESVGLTIASGILTPP